MRHIFILIVGLLILAGVFAGCEDDRSEFGSAYEDDFDSLQPDQITSDAHIYLYKAGRRTTDLTASEIRQFTILDSTIAYDLYVEFFDSTGERMSTLQADNGYIREKDNFLAVNGSVKVIGEDSVILLSEYLEWDAAKDSVVTDSFVTIIREGDTLTSYGMQSDPALKNISFKNASGRVSDIKKVQDETE